MAFVSTSLRAICSHLGISVSNLADRSGIHRTQLSRITNGHDDMSAKMLDKLLAQDEIPDDLAAKLAEDWTMDNWPSRAKQLLGVYRKAAGEPKILAEPLTPADELSMLFTQLIEKARSNPALARALLNLNRTLDGRTDVVD